jgi:carbon-monoxide dehydrogenase medium subunit
MNIKRIPEMRRLTYSPDDGLVIGAAVSCAEVTENESVREWYPALAKSSGLIGPLQIYNRASVGGNICSGAPDADTVPCLLVHEATVVLIGPRGRRELPLEEFLVDSGQTALAPDELLLEARVPHPKGVSRYQRLMLRGEGGIPTLGVAALLAVDGDERCTLARVALTAIARTPIRARNVEGYLEGRVLDAASLAEAGELASQALSTQRTLRGSPGYRREMVQVLTRRALSECLDALAGRAA